MVILFVRRRRAALGGWVKPSHGDFDGAARTRPQGDG